MSTPRPTQGGSYIRDPETGALSPQASVPTAVVPPAAPAAPVKKGGK